jgi:hypothetical protein
MNQNLIPSLGKQCAEISRNVGNTEKERKIGNKESWALDVTRF